MKRYWPPYICAAFIALATGGMFGVSVVIAVKQSVMAGPLVVLPKRCGKGDLFTVTDARRAFQQYTCGSNSAWMAPLTVGGSGGLVLGEGTGTFDINTAAIPFLQSPNGWLALQRMQAGLSLATTNAQPVCNAAERGTFWYLNHGTAKDNVQVCVYTGSAFAWISLY